jgi:two-component system, NtrC family, sensor kinase
VNSDKKVRPEYSLGQEEAKRLREAEKVFLSRPQLSIRIRIVAGFLLCFFLTGITAIVTLTILYQVRGKLHFLRTTQDITFEVLQARRFEKDFFLYGTNLKNAKECADRALTLLQSDTVNVLDVAGEKNLAEMSRTLGQYDALLGQCLALERTAPDEHQKKSLEEELRKCGSTGTDLAWALNAKESSAVDHMLSLSQAVPFAFLLLLLLLIFWVTHLLAKTITLSLARFQGYTRRIAGGDFTPIQPAKPYQDEFSDMAMAVNRMLFELRARESQVLMAGKLAAVGSFTTGIAHELSNPLTNISITVEALLDECEEGEGGDAHKHQLLSDIQRETERANRIIVGLLDFIRQDVPQAVPVNITEALDSAHDIVVNEMEIHNIQFTLEGPPGVLEVMATAHELRQAFLNLFLNSIEAMPNGGKLAVRVKRLEEGLICLEVSDEGVGIPLELLPKIFDPFFTTKPRGTGTGLGLSISYAIVKRFGGDIQVESVEGRGTTMRICLPEAVEICAPEARVHAPSAVRENPPLP